MSNSVQKKKKEKKKKGGEVQYLKKYREKESFLTNLRNLRELFH